VAPWYVSPDLTVEHPPVFVPGYEFILPHRKLQEIGPVILPITTIELSLPCQAALFELTKTGMGRAATRYGVTC